ncbi:MAG: CRISPR-associated protein Cas4, partial [Chloroflexi bacterium]|nr:CRISPR-associated protein Cas4 [Chloroflexota bacterium]
MFQIATNWRLLNLVEDSSGMTIRGYNADEPVALPAEFSDLPRLSVDRIAGIHCPTRRDLFLGVRSRKKGVYTWGRMAGSLIEQYCAGLLDRYQSLFKSGSQTYASIESEIRTYTSQFMASHSKEFSALSKKSSHMDDVRHLILLLEYSARSELAMLGADWTLRAGTPTPVRVSIDPSDVTLHPNARVIGISSPSTPDFLLRGLKAIGDVKSGDSFKDFYRLTCAGYALAYESDKKVGHEIDYGIIYFFQTHHRNFITTKTYT